MVVVNSMPLLGCDKYTKKIEITHLYYYISEIFTICNAKYTKYTEKE